MIEYISQIILSLTCPQINFVAHKDDRHFFINFTNSWHPVAFKPLNTFEVHNIIHQNYYMGFLDLDVIVLVLFLTAVCVD